MNVLFYFHVGYLVDMDARGVAIGWGAHDRPRKPGERLFVHYWQTAFPWWMSTSNIRHHLWVSKLRRMQRRAERRANG